MSTINYFTKKQLEVEKWINSLGLRTKLEVGVDRYIVDIEVPEVYMAVEIDGPTHKKLPKEGRWVTLGNLKDKRDVTLIVTYFNGIYHVPVDIEEDLFKTEFQKIIEKVSAWKKD